MVDFSNIRQNLGAYYKSNDKNIKKNMMDDAAKEATKLLNEMDVNKDGVVSREEFANEIAKEDNFKGASLSADQKKGLLNLAKNAANKVDQNNNGIQEDELMSYLLYEDSTKRNTGLIGNSSTENVDGKVDDFAKYIALKNLSEPIVSTSSTSSTTYSTGKTANDNLNNFKSKFSPQGVKTNTNKNTISDNMAQEAKVKIAKLKDLGITLNTSEPSIINKISISAPDSGGKIKISGISGTSSNPIQINIINGINIFEISDSSNVKIKADKINNVIAKDPTKVIVEKFVRAQTSTQAAMEKLTDLKRLGFIPEVKIPLSTSDANIINNITITPYYYNGSVSYDLKGLHATAENPLKIHISYDTFLKSTTKISEASNVQFIEDKSNPTGVIKVSISGSPKYYNNQNVTCSYAYDRGYEKLHKLLKLGFDIGPTQNTLSDDVFGIDRINDIKVSPSLDGPPPADGIYSISGIIGQPNEPIIIEVAAGMKVNLSNCKYVKIQYYTGATVNLAEKSCTNGSLTELSVDPKKPNKINSKLIKTF